MRAAIFIDGGYLLKQLQDAKVNPDYSRLAEFLLKPLRRNTQLDLMRCYFYYCPPWMSEKPTEAELRRMAAHDRFVAEIQEGCDRWQVRLGKLERRREGDKEVFAQKRVDVQLSVDLVQHTAAGHIQHAVLVAGDSDFIPAIVAAKESGTTLTLWCDRDRSVHRDLLKLADEVHYIRWKDFPSRPFPETRDQQRSDGGRQDGRGERPDREPRVDRSDTETRVAKDPRPDSEPRADRVDREPRPAKDPRSDLEPRADRPNREPPADSPDRAPRVAREPRPGPAPRNHREAREPHQDRPLEAVAAPQNEDLRTEAAATPAEGDGVKKKSRRRRGSGKGAAAKAAAQNAASSGDDSIDTVAPVVSPTPTTPRTESAAVAHQIPEKTAAPKRTRQPRNAAKKTPAAEPIEAPMAAKPPIVHEEEGDDIGNRSDEANATPTKSGRRRRGGRGRRRKGGHAGTGPSEPS